MGHVTSVRHPDHPLALGPIDRLTEPALLELTAAARELARDIPTTHPTHRAYQRLADAAEDLRYIRHGADRLREQRQAGPDPT